MKIQQHDPDEDERIVKETLDEIVTFVVNGPYCQEGNNVCWFCFQGIGPFENAEQGDAGHHPTCQYLRAWYMVHYGGNLGPRQ